MISFRKEIHDLRPLISTADYSVWIESWRGLRGGKNRKTVAEVADELRQIESLRLEGFVWHEAR